MCVEAVDSNMEENLTEFKELTSNLTPRQIRAVKNGNPIDHPDGSGKVARARNVWRKILGEEGIES